MPKSFLIKKRSVKQQTATVAKKGKQLKCTLRGPQGCEKLPRVKTQACEMKSKQQEISNTSPRLGTEVSTQTQPWRHAIVTKISPKCFRRKRGSSKRECSGEFQEQNVDNDLDLNKRGCAREHLAETETHQVSPLTTREPVRSMITEQLHESEAESRLLRSTTSRIRQQLTTAARDNDKETQSENVSSDWNEQQSAGSADFENGGKQTGENRSSYPCSLCGKSYATSSNLSRHKQTHRSLDSKQAKACGYCGKRYVSMPALSMHVLTHERSHECHMCGKRFSRPWLLQGHVRSHTGERPFECNKCGKSFADRSNLRAHEQTHSLLKQFRCERCNRSFALKSYLMKHLEATCLGNEAT